MSIKARAIMFAKELTAFFFQFWGVVCGKKENKVIVKQDIHEGFHSLTPHHTQMRKLFAQFILFLVISFIAVVQ